MMKLYGFPGSTNTWKVQAVAHALGAELSFALVDLTRGEQHAPVFKALNAAGRVPVLVDGDSVLWESNAIIRYLASRTSTPLWPDDPKHRAEIECWQSWQLAHWTPGCQPLRFERLIKPSANMGDPDQRVIEYALQIFHRSAAVLEQTLSSQTYLVRDQLSLADFSVVVECDNEELAGLPLGDYPAIRRWLAHMRSLPSVQQTHPGPRTPTNEHTIVQQRRR